MAQDGTGNNGSFRPGGKPVNPGVAKLNATAGKRANPQTPGSTFDFGKSTGGKQAARTQALLNQKKRFQ